MSYVDIKYVSMDNETRRTYFREYQRARRQTLVGKLAVARSNLKALHGLKLEDYQALYERQRGRCALCGSPVERGFVVGMAPGKRGPRPNAAQIDHDHACCPGRKSCGRCIRGLLCNRCNTGLMGFRDDPELLRKAINYLDKVSR